MEPVRRSRSRWGLLAIGALASVVGCGSPASAQKKPTALGRTTAPSTESVSSEAACVEPAKTVFAPELAKLRSEALDLLLTGHPEDAASKLEEVLSTAPANVAAYAMIRSVQVAVTKGQEERGKRFDIATPLAVDGPIGAHVVNHEVELPKGDELHLRVVTDRTITGAAEENWWEAHGIADPRSVEPDMEAQNRTFRSASWTAEFRFPDHRIDRYSTMFVGLSKAPSDPPRIFDFSAMTASKQGGGKQRFGVEYARIVGRSLVAEVTNPGDLAAKENQYLVSIDVETGAVQWVSNPGVAGTGEFVVAGRYAITGTAGIRTGGAIHVVDLARGEVVESKDLSFYPERIVSKDNRILVLGYGSEAELEITPSLPAAPVALFDPGGEPKPPLTDEQRADACRLRRAMAALDARDGKSALAETELVHDRKSLPALALGGAAKFLVRIAENPDAAVDLTAKTAIPIASFEPLARVERPPGASEPSFKLVLKSTSPSTRWADDTAFPDFNAFQSDPAPFEVPDAYGNASLEKNHGTRTGAVLVYGDAYVAVLEGKKPRAIFDFTKALRRTARQEILRPQIRDAVLGDGVLYLVVWGKTATGDEDFIVALDLAQSSILWKSASRVTTNKALVLADCLVTVHATDASTSTLSLLSKLDGRTLATTTLKAQPTELGFFGGNIFVERGGESDQYSLH